MISAVQNLVARTNNNQPPTHPDYRGFMAKIKFHSNIAEISEQKLPDACIDLEDAHHFFYRRPSFLTYSTLEITSVQVASGSTVIVGQGHVHLPIGSGIKVEAYHTPKFSCNVITVGLLSNNFETVFSKSLRNYRACYFMTLGTH